MVNIEQYRSYDLVDDELTDMEWFEPSGYEEQGTYSIEEVLQMSRDAQRLTFAPTRHMRISGVITQADGNRTNKSRATVFDISANNAYSVTSSNESAALEREGKYRIDEIAIDELRQVRWVLADEPAPRAHLQSNKQAQVSTINNAINLFKSGNAVQCKPRVDTEVKGRFFSFYNSFDNTLGTWKISSDTWYDFEIYGDHEPNVSLLHDLDCICNISIYSLEDIEWDIRLSSQADEDEHVIQAGHM